ncbi:transferase hexapeptide (six repeat-containing protein) [Pseudovibrio denitrificans]|uniref:Transferase hexapeptide (Six repeat-containing protein) n=1 Tax=Pseudovibrio denitrificans TaxID=258256 RepID=A0A1I7DEP4_9HYPH|nr:LpxA family transferase [Pseudovibrio denitrificans]SFU10193.1 transferase hexapeptide (six repeat-containing protein) [Pseudovibrio denitrificans]
MIQLSGYFANWQQTELAAINDAPWELTGNAADIIKDLLPQLTDGYRITNTVAIHESATVEDGATLKGPMIIGPNAFVSSRSYLRGGVYVSEGCAVGPFCEVKSSFMLKGSKLAHLGFLGDSILGENVNLEAGVVVANHRNEWTEKEIKLIQDRRELPTGAIKFGSLIGDRSKVGANSVLAPGTLLKPATIIPRLTSVDQQAEHLSLATQ